jgi:mono/diheme cytochrome c family protein
MRTFFLVSMGLAALATAAILPAAKPTARPTASSSSTAAGAALFGVKCGMCHRANGMGTVLLARRLDPQRAELEKRDDLSAAFVSQIARIGIANMPPISRAEVSQDELVLIASYLSKGKK